MAFYPGKAASITISASSRPFAQFDVDFKSEVVDTTNFTSGGYQTNEAGIFSADATYSGPANNSFGQVQGDSISATFASGGGGISVAVTHRLSSIKWSAAARNKVSEIAVTGTSNGSFTLSI